MPDRAGSECGKCCCVALTGGRAEYLRHCTAECRSGGHDSARKAADRPPAAAGSCPGRPIPIVPRCRRNQAINPNTWITRTNPVGVVGRSVQAAGPTSGRVSYDPSSISASHNFVGRPAGVTSTNQSPGIIHKTTIQPRHAHLRLLLAFLLLHHGCFTCFCFVVSCAWGQQQKMRIVMERGARRASRGCRFHRKTPPSPAHAKHPRQVEGKPRRRRTNRRRKRNQFHSILCI